MRNCIIDEGVMFIAGTIFDAIPQKQDNPNAPEFWQVRQLPVNPRDCAVVVAQCENKEEAAEKLYQFALAYDVKALAKAAREDDEDMENYLKQLDGYAERYKLGQVELRMMVMDCLGFKA